MVKPSHLALEKYHRQAIQQVCLKHRVCHGLCHVRMAKLLRRVMAIHLLALPSRQAARDRVCLSGQVQPAQLLQATRLSQVKLLAKRQLQPPDQVPADDLAAEYSHAFRF
jgi:hypothetical protein